MATKKHPSPERCEECGQRDFDGQVCAWCSWRPPCLHCGGKVRTLRRDAVYCGEKCRRARYMETHPRVGKPEDAAELLVHLSDDRFRELLSSVAKRREHLRAAAAGIEPAPGGRLRVRWGRYRERT